jgi:hypothetical protein
MDEETQKTIEEQMAALPQEIKTILANFDWASRSNELGQKHGIHVDQLGQLQTEILMVLIGIIPPDEFENELKTVLGLPAEKVTAIVNDANEMIFKPVRQSLVDVYEGVLTDEDVAPETEDVLKSSGVEVLEAQKGDGPQNSSGVRPLGSTPAGIVAQKLSGSFNLPKEETDLSLVNKGVRPPGPDAGVGPLNAPATASKIDPYREKPI